MDIKTIIILLLIFALAIAIEQLTKKADNNNIKITEYPYKQKYLLTKTEYKFYKTLKTICDKQQIIICPKVRLEDFVEVISKDNKQKYRGYIQRIYIFKRRDLGGFDMIGFVIGLLVGGTAGVFTMCLCTTAKQADENMSNSDK